MIYCIFSIYTIYRTEHTVYLKGLHLHVEQLLSYSHYICTKSLSYSLYSNGFRICVTSAYTAYVCEDTYNTNNHYLEQDERSATNTINTIAENIHDFSFLSLLHTMHKSALFTIVYCNFFTDNRFLTVRLSVVCCDMSVVDYED